jgi:hypothetical protein
MANTIVKLQKPNRACGSTTFIQDTVRKYAKSTKFIIVTPASYMYNIHREPLRDLVKEKLVEFYSYDEINQGRFAGRTSLRDTGIVVVTDYVDYTSVNGKSNLDMYMLDQFVYLCGGYAIMEIDVPTMSYTGDVTIDANGHFFAPYIPLQYTSIKITI